jgi:hypothetical protein
MISHKIGIIATANNKIKSINRPPVVPLFYDFIKDHRLDLFYNMLVNFFDFEGIKHFYPLFAPVLAIYKWIIPYRKTLSQT